MNELTEMTRTPSETEALGAASEIVAAFAATDTARYFSAFSVDASFVFHPEPRRLNSRAEYERLWASWVSSGWRVVECRSTEQLAQVFPGGAVFSHTVHTTTETQDSQESYAERETIVFRVEGDELIAIHEHLSAPTSPAA